MNPRFHGGDLHQIKQKYSSVKSPWIDLSTGINPWGYPWLEKIAPDILYAASNRLPGKDDLESCREAYADYLGCTKEKLLFGPGSQVFIERMPMLFSHTEVYILGPTYHEHGRSWDRMGHIIHYLPYSLESLLIIPKAKVVILTSPNNPDGQVIEKSKLYNFIQGYCEDNGSVIIDEAYMDLTPENSLLNYDLPPQAYVLRSVGKFFGLSGMRLGAIYAAPSFCHRLKSLSALWNISTVTLTVATHAVKDHEWIANTRQKLSSEMDRLCDMIISSGYEIIGKTDLFCLITGEDIPELNHRLAQRGIYARPFHDQRNHLRLGLPRTNGAFIRLKQAFRKEKYDRERKIRANAR